MRSIYFLLIFCLPAFSKSLSNFNARLFSNSEKTGLLKFRTDFSNQRFITAGMKVKFRTNKNLDYYCEAAVLSKTARHFLLRLTHKKKCYKYQNMSNGVEGEFVSGDFERNIETTNELVKILNKKRMAIYGKLKVTKKRLDSFYLLIYNLSVIYNLSFIIYNFKEKVLSIVSHFCKLSIII